ncbi:hypothetical protein BD626DRAFT_413685, partial [Schizophyllum amplum]
INHLPVEMLHEIACLLDMPNLATLVCVNKRWQVIAEAIIWRDLPSLVPLLRLLDSDAIFDKSMIVERNGDLPSNLWKEHPNLVRLAAHVRTLILHPMSDFNTDCMLDTFATQERTGTFTMHSAFKATSTSLMKAHPLKLFPHLRTLVIGTALRHGFPAKLLVPFINDGLTTLIAHCPVNYFHRINHSSIDNFHFLERSLRRNVGQDTIAPQSLLSHPTISVMAGRIDSLHTLKLRLLCSKDLHVLLAPGAHHLRTLDLDIRVLADPVDSYGLQGLRSLTVRKQPTAFACALMGSPHMEEIILLAAIIVDYNAVAQVLMKIRQDCRHSVLRRVCIRENDYTIRTVQTWYITRSCLAALMPFHNLVEIDISTSGELSMRDVDWAAVVPRWCSLRVFKVKQIFPWRRERRPETGEAPSPATTLASLATFATYCPYLEELGFQLHATSIPTLAGPQHALSQSRLRKLDVGHRSGINANPTLVADFLHTLFPSLTEVTVDAKRADIDSWNQVRQEVRRAGNAVRLL